MDRKDRFSGIEEAGTKNMQTRGSHPGASEREAELRRRNEEIDMRQNEALRVAQAVVRQQEAKLAQSPSGRSPARVSRSSAGTSPEQRPSSSRISNSKFLSHSDDENSISQPAAAKDTETDDSEGYEDYHQMHAAHSRSPAAKPQTAGSARRELQLEDNTRGAEREGVTPQMGAEATIRYLKAKLKVVEEELEESLAEAKESRDKLSAAEKRVHELEQVSAKAGSMQQSSKTKVEKLKAELEEKTTLVDSLERQLAASIKEKETMERNHRQAESATGTKDVRINRALEEVDKYKRMLAEAKTTHAEQLDVSRKQFDKVMAEKKKLVKQKNELLNGFKKQMKLIDILRRQLIHVQAAKLLSLTEDEFTRALELGETI